MLHVSRTPLYPTYKNYSLVITLPNRQKLAPIIGTGMSLLPFSLHWLIAHQPAAAAAYRHYAFGADGVSEFYGGFVVPDVCDGVGFDVADDVIVIIAAEADIAVAVDFQGHEDADALVISEGIAVIGIVAVDIVPSVKLWHHHGRAPSLSIGRFFPSPQTYQG